MEKSITRFLLLIGWSAVALATAFVGYNLYYQPACHAAGGDRMMNGQCVKIISIRIK